MPHIGGGGSHSGGHRGGSGGFHGRSGGSSGGGPRISSTYFKGSRRYVYYYRNSPHIYYGDGTDDNHTSVVIAAVIITVMGIILSFVAWRYSPLSKIEYKKWGKLERNYDDSIVIRDDMGMIENANALEECLKDFLDETGICICVAAIRPPSPDPRAFLDIDQKALDEYNERWRDEKHWLIYYEGIKADRSGYWEWSLICGDDCVQILNFGKEDKFTRELQEYLEDTDCTFDEAVIRAVNNLEPNLKGGLVYRYRDRTDYSDKYDDGEPVMLGHFLDPDIFAVYFFCFGILLIGLIMLVYAAADKKGKARAKAAATQDALSPLEAEMCINCGGVYYIDTVTECPYCGAQIKK